MLAIINSNLNTTLVGKIEKNQYNNYYKYHIEERVRVRLFQTNL